MTAQVDERREQHGSPEDGWIGGRNVMAATCATEAPQRDHIVTVDWHVNRTCVVTWLSGKTEIIQNVTREGADWLNSMVANARVPGQTQTCYT
jgi:hypothetical protein